MKKFGGSTVTFYVDNLPPKLHWSGLRQTFGRHGDLVDSFNANKMNSKGHRFGFVRFSNKRDAFRALERLNGFRLYGSKLTVSMARYNSRTLYWRRKKDNPTQNSAEIVKKQNEDSQCTENRTADMVADEQDMALENRTT
ncbi:hypothetical protein GQ457_02G040230 [Hibiscus cannabinus]